MKRSPVRASFPIVGRRKFIADSLLTAGSLLTIPAITTAATLHQGGPSLTVGDIMDMFMKEVPGAPLPGTVDSLKAGSRDLQVTGIVTTMFATVEIIRKSIEMGANFIIVHEPAFYNHPDEIAWLQQDEVYQYKAALLQQHSIAIWRNHDYIHSLVPDGVTSGVVQQLQWGKYTSPGAISNITLPAPTSLRTLIGHLKKNLAIEKVRFIGDPDQSCSRLVLLPGATGGRSQISAIAKEKPDVLICGEIQEWETAEYVRDARTEGHSVSLVVLGHIASEEPGSLFMWQWLQEKVPSVKSTHVPCGNSLSFL